MATKCEHPLQDVKVVAELACLSAGEVSYEIEKVKCFHDAVFGYSSFIYELKSDSSFADLKSAYEKVFTKLQNDPDLPEKYADSARHLSWFDKALETQGSVEKSSLERALQINYSGLYIIKYAPNFNEDRKVLIELDDVVVLEYKEESRGADGEKSLVDRGLTLSELRDLLSRLMLIVGKDKSDHAQTVDVFITTFQNVERLASSFVTLYNSGCAFFNSWSLHFRTNSYSMKFPAVEINIAEIDKPLCSYSMTANDELSSLCVALESIGTKWEEYLFAMRCKHPILNEFNMQQLSVLCSALAKLKRSNSSNHLDPSAKYYLDSINDMLDTADLVKILNEDYTEGADVDDQTECFILSDTSIPLKDITKNGHTDERSALLALIESLKSQFNDNDVLAKAGIQAVCTSISQNIFQDEDEIVNWIIDNEENNENVAQLAQEFDDYFSTLDRNETGAGVGGSNTGISEYAQKMEVIFDKYLSGLKQNALDDFVNLYQIAHVLSRCQELKEAATERNEEQIEGLVFPNLLKTGRPNLVLCDRRSDILLYILSLYCYVSKDSLPAHNQVLLCSDRTSVDELEVFMLRAMLDPNEKVYTIAFADDLSPICSDHIEKLIFDKIKHTSTDYKLVVFNSDESSQASIVLEQFKTRQAKESKQDLRNYLCDNLRCEETDLIDSFRCRLITSTQPSSGKSLHLDRVESQMKQDSRQCERVIHRLFDRHVDFEKLLDFLWIHKDLQVPTIVHLDVSPN
ncbi:E3 ubiquitin-protein ligase rnf213-alpha-like, partial [Convolutriloba macropyga]|uniref:E3 ubiquitin-protein ligase rnf213-alpha-like n=1 Tax=Convolutriloba macropyga TaxID=536237 RepID=UPI003F5212FD